VSRKAEFYQQLADQAAQVRNDEYRRGWNECMAEVMQYDKPWSDPGKGALRSGGQTYETGPRPTLTVPKHLPPPPVEGLTYVAGPMSNVGPPTWNYPAFAEMAFKLRDAGLNVVSPHELHDADETVPWDRYLREDLARLIKCTRVVFLPGWAKSRGASLEHAVAKALGLELIFPEEFEEWFSAR
jgi:hypothetical protein